MSDGFKFGPNDIPKRDLPSLQLPYCSTAFEEQRSLANKILYDVQAECTRKKADEEAYRQETIRCLHAIEQKHGKSLCSG